MKFVLKSLRFLFLAILLLAIVLPAAFYVLLSADWAQDRVRMAARETLTRLLGTEVEIGHVTLSPFERLHICEVDIYDDHDSVAAHIDRVEARIEMLELMLTRRLVIDYAEISGLEAHLYRATPHTPLNIRGIVDHLQSRPKKQSGSKPRLALNNLTVRNSHFCYDVHSAEPTPGRFNPSHISLDSLDLTVYAPEISDSGYTMELQHLSAREQSGFTITDLGFLLSISSSELSLEGFHLNLPNSHIGLSTLRSPLENGANSLPSLLSEIPVEVEVQPESKVYPPDFQAFVPNLAKLETSVNLHALGSVSRDSVLVNVLSAKTDNGLSAMLSGNVYGLRKPDSISFRDLSFQIDASATALRNILGSSGARLDKKVSGVLAKAPDIRVNGTADGTILKGQADVTLSTAQGNAMLVADYRQIADGIYDVEGNASLNFSDLGHILQHKDLTELAAKAHFSLTAGHGRAEGNGQVQIDRLAYRSHLYADITAEGEFKDGRLTARAQSADPSAAFTADIDYASVPKSSHTLSLKLNVDKFSPYALALTQAYPGYSLSASAAADLQLAPGEHDKSHEAITGDIVLSGLSFTNDSGEGVNVPEMRVSLDTSNPIGGISVDSKLLSGQINGYIVPSTLLPDILEIARRCQPELVEKPERELSNSFVYDFTIDNAEPLCRLLGLPFSIVHPVSLTGSVDASSAKASLALDAPWLMQGDKVVENTAIALFLNGHTSESAIYATTLMPTKKGPMSLIARLDGRPGKVTTDIDWQIQRAIPISGKIDFDASFRRADDGDFHLMANFRPSAINFGQDVWQISPSTIEYFDKILTVNNFSLSTPTQRIDITTPVTPPGEEKVLVALTNLNLIDIFETLEINNALIGGSTTGEIVLTDIFTGRPKLFSPGLTVKDISYNYCTLGDAMVKMNYDNDLAAFILDADVINPKGRHSKIYGSITPSTEELDITFLADDVRVGFLKPFMSAFASDIRGHASGKAHLFGTFKYIDLEGDVYADSVQVKIDFTNTWYTASDSIHIRPGSIDLHDITITDTDGNRALLNGSVKHTFFSAPVFDFSITGAENFLCYNVTEKLSPDWYGKIYGDGSAKVHGQPGKVDISVNMATKANSNFTFVLSDMEVADEYSFIEFRDATPVAVVDSITEVSAIPQAVLDYRARQARQANSSPTAFNLDIQVDVTPQAQVVIVMDPVGGDRIRAFGSGNLRMTYGSVDNDLRMYGTYTLERGDYNFTLQDIIIKDFTIQPGSSITFRGDPYSAQLDLQAVYAVNANLSDLDESFLSDKELNRTKVPVHALMKVTGDMRQPSIAFDLNFPTLTSDTYRKVRSIVSTDEMMNRQIIYLLALNRFYTPDYMASTTRGNELFSVASATIGSQLSSMLGKLSDNWSIAPNLRSERGDFSDIEVDLTLSSRLLNNRLLFNGNLGYRDKSLNTNRFVGDFDIEYLLNRRGTWRLKAYNRYNDQNYYLRTAQTTQGIGIMYRRDFDNMFNFLKPKRKKKSEDEAEPVDSVQLDTTPISHPNAGQSDK